MYSTTDFRRGLKIELDDKKPYEIIEFQHFKPGKGGAMIRTKLRGLLNGRVIDKTFRSGEKVEKPDLGTTDMQYLYKEGSEYIFMDMESYEQVHVSEENVGEKGGFLKEADTVPVLLYKGELIDIELPSSVYLVVSHTEPGVQGDRVSNATKPATLETGLLVQVPLFIDIGTRIKVDTRTCEYLGRE